MGKILDAFAIDHIDSIVEKRSPKHKRLYEKSHQLRAELEKKLNDGEKQILDSLMETMFDEGACYAETKFIRGYRLGVLMMVEVFEGQNEFIERSDE